MAPSPRQLSASALDAQLQAHERRFDRTCNAWHVASGEVWATWAELGLVGDGVWDEAEMRELVADDLKAHELDGLLSWPSFIAHYNRLVEARAGLFTRLYTLQKVLGQGGFGKVVLGVREGRGAGYETE